MLKNRFLNNGFTVNQFNKVINEVIKMCNYHKVDYRNCSYRFIVNELDYKVNVCTKQHYDLNELKNKMNEYYYIVGKKEKIESYGNYSKKHSSKKYKIILFTINNDLKKIDFIERINLLNKEKFRTVYNWKNK